MEFRILRYDDSKNNEWDAFVGSEALGTLYHTRRFLEYHPTDRFQDASILVYSDKQLACVLPCCRRGERYFSHSGATFGGPVIRRDLCRARHIFPLVQAIVDHYKGKIDLRLASQVYHINSEPSLVWCAFGLHGSVRFELSWYTETSVQLVDKMRNKKNRKELAKLVTDPGMNVSVAVDDAQYAAFHALLSEVLLVKHGTAPTHLLSELLEFRQRLTARQSLHILEHKGLLIAGVFVLHVTDNAWYTVYPVSRDGGNGAALALCIQHVLDAAHREGVNYLDYGISTEDRGTHVNLGLSVFKQDTLCGKPHARYLFEGNKE
jgi:hypothetical protein